MAIHRIRLREPWDVVQADDGTTRHRRAFQKPTGLASDDIVRIVVEQGAGLREMMVNLERLTLPEAHLPMSCRITPLLQPRNLVELLLDADGSRGEVCLEIETSHDG
jgi:hypothetical protein